MAQARHNICQYVIPAPAAIAMELDARADIMRECELRAVALFQQAQHAGDALGVARLLRKGAVEIGLRAECIEGEDCPAFGYASMPFRFGQFIAVADRYPRQVRAFLFQNVQNAQVFVTPDERMNIDTGPRLLLHAGGGS